MSQRDNDIRNLQREWAENPRWKGITRAYGADEVIRLRGSIAIEHSLARRGATRLWELLHSEPFVNSLGALTGNQAMQQVKAGLKAIYLSGWQVAGDANLAGEMYPDQSLYPANSVPQVVRRINNSLARCDQIQWMEGRQPGDEGYIDFFAPIVADAEAGFGGVLNAFELMKGMIEAGAAGVHFEDQLASVKKCGHMGGKVLVPTRDAVAKLVAARLAADVMGTPTLLESISTVRFFSSTVYLPVGVGYFSRPAEASSTPSSPACGRWCGAGSRTGGPAGSPSMVTVNVCLDRLATPMTAGPVLNWARLAPTDSMTVLLDGQ